MTKEEASIIIGNIPINPDTMDDCYSITEYQEAKAMAIKALEQELRDCKTCIHSYKGKCAGTEECHECMWESKYEQQSCDDCISRAEAIKALEYDLSIEVDGGLDKYRTVIKDLLNAIYNTQKKAIEDLPSVQPKEIYDKGWKDGAEATAYHVELCEEENPTIPLSVIDAIKAEIENNMESIVGKYDCKTPERQMASRKFERNEARKECLEIIDKHIAEKPKTLLENVSEWDKAIEKNGYVN